MALAGPDEAYVSFTVKTDRCEWLTDSDTLELAGHARFVIDAGGSIDGPHAAPKPAPGLVRPAAEEQCAP